MELRMNPVTLPEPITFNYEELKAALTEKVAVYEKAVYTEDQLIAAKADRANLNKLKKALNDERIRREREYMQPFSDFKAQIAEIIGIIDKPVAAIDKQIKRHEERKREEKQKAIEEFFNGCKWQTAVRLEQIFDPRWLNASYSMVTIKEDITLRMEQIVGDISAIRALPEYAFEAEAAYMTHLNLSKALAEANRLREVAAHKAEFEARKAEREAQAQKALAEQQAATVAKKETVEPEPAPAAEKPAEEAQRHWLMFKAHLTVEDARALRAFFEGRGIEFEAV